METNTIHSNVKIALSETIQEFQVNPFNFFYEEDIRATLFFKLKQIIGDEGNYDIDDQFVDLKKIYPEGIKSNLVKSEYPYDAGFGRKRFDVAVLHPAHIDFYKCPVQIGIEIKMGSKETKMEPVSGYFENIVSLREYRCHLLKQKKSFTGIAIYFYQTTLAQPDMYFSSNPIEYLDIKDIEFKPNEIYALVVSKGEVFKVTKYKIEIPLG
ncbi:MAG: hypothetical protein GYA14_13940 [Ignavibacteria bacterium]|nr:hypothetical protein [Ignavibacteria bacterium]